jgi:hypothetical protein
MIFSINKRFFYNYLFPKRISQKLDNSQQINAGIAFNFEAWACGPTKQKRASSVEPAHNTPPHLPNSKTENSSQYGAHNGDRKSTV